MKTKILDIIKIKRKILDISFLAKEGHIPSSYSVLNILDILVKFFIFKNKKYLNNFILSKGHAVLGYYAVLNFHGYLREKKFLNFCKYKNPLGGHPSLNLQTFTSASTGSLGHGFPIIAGMAYSDPKKNYYTIIGDQECNEGTIWETFFFCSHHKIKNLTVIIDRNFSRNEALSLGNLKSKLKQFFNNIMTINGHNNKQILKSLKIRSNSTKIIIANTIKGFGIKLMEHNNEWHHKFPKDKSDLEKLKKMVIY
jgi:transketolase